MKSLNRNIRVGALDTLSDNILRFYHARPELGSDAYLQRIMVRIDEFSTQLTTAIKSDKIRSRVEAADDRRDEVIRLLGALLKGYTVLPVPEKKAAAEQLLAVFNKYKGIIRARYSDESSYIESLLEDFAAPSLADAIASLEGVERYLADLRAAQDVFQQAHDEFAEATANKSESATSLKKPLLAVINDDLLPYLVQCVKMDKDRYGEFVALVEAEVEKENRNATSSAPVPNATDAG